MKLWCRVFCDFTSRLISVINPTKVTPKFLIVKMFSFIQSKGVILAQRPDKILAPSPLHSSWLHHICVGADNDDVTDEQCVCKCACVYVCMIVIILT